MEIHLESGRPPERATAVVLIGHDGRFGTVAAELDEASGGLLRRDLDVQGHPRERLP